MINLSPINTLLYYQYFVCRLLAKVIVIRRVQKSDFGLPELWFIFWHVNTESIIAYITFQTASSTVHSI